MNKSLFRALDPASDVRPSGSPYNTSVAAKLVVAQSQQRPSVNTSGRVYWVTGLSGAGKTTVGELLRARFQDVGVEAVQLDGDRLRALIDPQAGYSAQERRRLAFAYGSLCFQLANQGFVVICTTISMFHDVREWNRSNIAGYREIYLSVPIKTLSARDSKGLYRGNAVDVVGIDVPAEEPLSPDLKIESSSDQSPEETVEKIWQSLILTDTGFGGGNF